MQITSAQKRALIKMSRKDGDRHILVDRTALLLVKKGLIELSRDPDGRAIPVPLAARKVGNGVKGDSWYYRLSPQGSELAHKYDQERFVVADKNGRFIPEFLGQELRYRVAVDAAQQFANRTGTTCYIWSLDTSPFPGAKPVKKIAPDN